MGAPTDPLLDLLRPILDRLHALAPETRTSPASHAELLATLNRELPVDGPQVAAIGAELERGVREGWLCDRGEPDARFSRVARPSPQTRDLSIDVVSLQGAALRHTHPRGEITLGFAAPGSDPSAVRFDGHGPGWVFCAPGSTHTPTTTGGRMHLLYFLPKGAVTWHSSQAPAPPQLP